MSATPQVTRLRPLGIGEILDAGFRLVRRRFGTLVACTLAITVPLEILRTLVLASTNDAAFDFSGNGTRTNASGSAAAGSLISNLIEYVMLALVLAACFRAISAAYLGHDVGAGESLRFAFGRLLPLLGAVVMTSLVVLVGFVLLIVPGIWIGVRLAMTFPAIVFERLGPLQGMKRSFQLVGGNWWRTFAVLLVALLLVAVLSLALGLVVGAIAGAVAPDSRALGAVLFTVIGILLSALLYPVWAGIATVLYYDLRVRKEGFDLELLAQAVGAGPAPAEPSAGWSTPERSSESFGGFLPPDRSPERP